MEIRSPRRTLRESQVRPRQRRHEGAAETAEQEDPIEEGKRAYHRLEHHGTGVLQRGPRRWQTKMVPVGPHAPRPELERGDPPCRAREK